MCVCVCVYVCVCVSVCVCECVCVCVWFQTKSRHIGIIGPMTYLIPCRTESGFVNQIIILNGYVLKTCIEPFEMLDGAYSQTVSIHLIKRVSCTKSREHINDQKA